MKRKRKRKIKFEKKKKRKISKISKISTTIQIYNKLNENEKKRFHKLREIKIPNSIFDSNIKDKGLYGKFVKEIIGKWIFLSVLKKQKLKDVIKKDLELFKTI